LGQVPEPFSKPGWLRERCGPSVQWKSGKRPLFPFKSKGAFPKLNLGKPYYSADFLLIYSYKKLADFGNFFKKQTEICNSIITSYKIFILAEIVTKLCFRLLDNDVYWGK
jgi:hypothetical protein